MPSSTPTSETAVPMRELLAAGAAAAAVCTPPEAPSRTAPRTSAKPDDASAQAITVTRVPVGAKSQSV